MKTVIHHNKVYDISDSDFKCLSDYEKKLNSLPSWQRKGSLEYQLFKACKSEVFSSSEYKNIAKRF